MGHYECKGCGAPFDQKCTCSPKAPTSVCVVSSDCRWAVYAARRLVRESPSFRYSADLLACLAARGPLLLTFRRMTESWVDELDGRDLPADLSAVKLEPDGAPAPLCADVPTPADLAAATERALEPAVEIEVTRVLADLRKRGYRGGSVCVEATAPTEAVRALVLERFRARGWRASVSSERGESFYQFEPA